MKFNLIALSLATVMLLTACAEKEPDSGQNTSAPTPQITTSGTLSTSVPDVTTDKAPEDAPTSTTTVGADDPNVPVVPPGTDDPPVTTLPQDPPDEPVVGDVKIPSELKNVASIYTPMTELSQEDGQKTLFELIQAASKAFEGAKHRSVKASGQLALDKGIVTFMLGASAVDLQLSYLSNGSMYELTSKTTTDTGKVAEDHQVYIGGWMYNTSVYKENGKQTGTDNYKIKMTQAQFSENALYGADSDMNDLSGLAKMISTAKYNVAGVMKDGRTVILAKGVDAKLMNSAMTSGGSFASAISEDSYSQMEIALVIGTDGSIDELYIDLPLNVVIDEGGIRFTVKGHLDLKILVDIPATVVIAAPDKGSSYKELSISEVYGNNAPLFRW